MHRSRHPLPGTFAALVGIIVAAGCSSSGHPATSASSPGTTPSATTATASQQPTGGVHLTENSTCADYQQATDAEQTQFLTEEVTAHVPQTNASVTIAIPGGSPSIGNGNSAANSLFVISLKQTLPTMCAQNPSARLGDVLASAWSFSPSSP